MKYLYFFIFCYFILWVFFIYGCFIIKNHLDKNKENTIHIV